MSELELPTTRYARSGDISVAYQTMGHGSIDLIVVLGIVSHVEFMHEIIPGWTDLLRRLAAFARVVTFDKRGQGLSDRMPGVPLLEERMDDVSAIMEARERSCPNLGAALFEGPSGTCRERPLSGLANSRREVCRVHGRGSRFLRVRCAQAVRGDRGIRHREAGE